MYHEEYKTLRLNDISSNIFITEHLYRDIHPAINNLLQRHLESLSDIKLHTAFSIPKISGMTRKHMFN